MSKEILEVYSSDRRANLMRHQIMKDLKPEWGDEILKFENTGYPAKIIAKYIEDTNQADMSIDSFLNYYIKSGEKRKSLIEDRTTVSKHSLNRDFGRDNNDLLELTREFYVKLVKKGFFEGKGEVSGEIILNAIVIRIIDSMFFRVVNIIKVMNTFNTKKDSSVYFAAIKPQIADTSDIDLIVYSKESDLMLGFVKLTKGVSQEGMYVRSEYDSNQEAKVRRVFNLDIAYVSVTSKTINATQNLKEIVGR